MSADEPSQIEKSRASSWTARSSRGDEADWRALTRWLEGGLLEAGETAMARSAAQTLVEDEDRTRAVLGHCPTAVAVLDADGKLVGFNRQFHALAGNVARLDVSIAELLEPADRVMLETVIRSAGTPQAAGATIRLSADSVGRNVEFLAATIPTASGISAGVVLAAEDHTARMMDEGDRVATLGSVGDANRNAAFALAAAAIVHDLGNFVGAASLAVGALTDGKYAGASIQDATVAALLDDARAALEQGVKILQGVRDIAHARGSLGASSDVEEVVASVGRVIRPALRRAAVNIECRVAPGLVVAITRSELTQVVTNLLENALHAIEDGGEPGLVVVEAERVTEDTPMVLLRVRDDGVGIEPGRLATVFNPFETSRSDRGGTGLGLAIVKRVADTAGGRVQIVSLPNRGTEVLVHLPSPQ